MSLDDRVLISTHDLRAAGALRSAFDEAGYGTELVTPREDLADAEGDLLVLTGGYQEGGRGLARQARDAGMPIFALATESSLAPAQRPGFEEVFVAGTPAGDVAMVARRLLERKRLQDATGIVGESDAVREVLERIVQIAPVDATVLVTGESGTGKELVARGIHHLSTRRHQSFIAVNVAAISESLLESELFGHEKGAFTGAVDSRKGLFELAHKGTIFLDEIGEMPLTTQTKLLRVLEQREFHRVGGERTIEVDVRIIAATNQALRELVAVGEFRRDLYFRLKVLSIELPPLRERRDDIPLLVEAFVRDSSERHDRPFPGISAEAMDILRDYAWPGNVRELKNLIESMVVLGSGRPLQAGDVPSEVRAGRGRSLLPAPIARPPTRRGGDRKGEAVGDASPADLRPELEFIFRTLVDMRVDMDDLRREFEAYRRASENVWHHPGAIPATAVEIPAFRDGAWASDDAPGGVHVAQNDGVVLPEDHGPDATGHDDDDAHGVVVFRPGMTMDALERRAIEAALDSVDGNRRKAAELLGIGERTLYRKIAKYDLADV